MSEEIADEYGVGCPSNEASGGMPEPVQSDRSELCGGACSFVSAPYRGCVDPATPSVAQHVVFAVEEFVAVCESREHLNRGLGERYEAMATAPGKGFLRGGQAALDQQQAIGKVDVGPSAGSVLFTRIPLLAA